MLTASIADEIKLNTSLICVCSPLLESFPDCPLPDKPKDDEGAPEEAKSPAEGGSAVEKGIKKSSDTPGRRPNSPIADQRILHARRVCKRNDLQD